MDYTEELDYSSLDTYMSCKRAFYFQYIAHLRYATPNIDLTFGSCWHYGLEVVYKAIKEDKNTFSKSIEATKAAITAFNQLWSLTSEHFNDDICFPKNPGHAANMYSAYWKRYFAEDKKTEIIGIESPFTITIDPTLPDYIGRLDLVTISSDGILNIVDHKTSKYNNNIVFSGFKASLQTDGYLTAGNMYFDKIPQITYNLALCQKSRIDFNRFIIRKSKAAIDRFLSDLTHQMHSLLNDISIYKEERINTSRNYNPTSFKRTAGYACTKYFRECPYYFLCEIRNNPFLWEEKPPQGYMHYEWNPRTHEAELKRKLKEAGE